MKHPHHLAHASIILIYMHVASTDSSHFPSVSIKSLQSDKSGCNRLESGSLPRVDWLSQVERGAPSSLWCSFELDTLTQSAQPRGMASDDLLQRRSSRRNVKLPTKYQESVDPISGSDDDPAYSSQGVPEGQFTRGRSLQVHSLALDVHQSVWQGNNLDSRQPRDLDSS